MRYIIEHATQAEGLFFVNKNKYLNRQPLFDGYLIASACGRNLQGQKKPINFAKLPPAAAHISM
jgi:hypothetical protein